MRDAKVQSETVEADLSRLTDKSVATDGLGCQVLDWANNLADTIAGFANIILRQLGHT
jgi:hypothetical protein